MKVVVANRGEIARRIIRTASRLGYGTVALYTAADSEAQHVQEADEAIFLDASNHDRDGYLCIDLILEAIEQIRSNGQVIAVHPGYGFLAENTEFADAVSQAGLIWVGPNSDVIDSMGSKINARKIAEDAGLATIPGFSASQDIDDLQSAAVEIGFPVLVKASAGGGGKGIRIARQEQEFEEALREAKTEALRAFGDDRVIVERFIEKPRHIEVQIIGDQFGSVIDLGTRECSVQRRYQKVLEEAPAPNLSAETDASIRKAAVDLASSVGYSSAGTVEFIVDGETEEFFFLEMNTRLQVEHPVTEAITGFDLVELMLEVAIGNRLPISAEDVTFSGHAIEARIAAEDAGAGFVPQIGVMHHVLVPEGVRWDAAIEPGSEISPHYDSMIAKLIVHSNTRDQALSKLKRALDGLVLGGVRTTAGFQRWLVEQPEVLNATVTTRFLDSTELPTTPKAAVSQAAMCFFAAEEHESGTNTPWSARPHFSLTPRIPVKYLGLVDVDGNEYDYIGDADGEDTAMASDVDGAEATEQNLANTNQAVVDVANRMVTVNVAGHSHFFKLPTRSERWAPKKGSGINTDDAVVAPFPALVSEVNVSAGDEVEGGQVVVVIEAMKMLHSLKAQGPATIDQVLAAVGDQVESNQVLVTFSKDNESEETP